MTGQRGVPGDTDAAARLFEAEAAYAESMFCQALGDTEGSIANAERALAIEPDYAPALLTVGSIAYQLGEEERGATLFAKLADLPDDDGDLWEILDRAGEFIIDERRYGAGLRLYAVACRTFPERLPS